MLDLCFTFLLQIVFKEMLLLEKYNQNCQDYFGRSNCEWVNLYTVKVTLDKYPLATLLLNPYTAGG